MTPKIVTLAYIDLDTATRELKKNKGTEKKGIKNKITNNSSFLPPPPNPNKEGLARWTHKRL